MHNCDKCTWKGVWCGAEHTLQWMCAVWGRVGVVWGGMDAVWGGMGVVWGGMCAVWGCDGCSVGL